LPQGVREVQVGVAPLRDLHIDDGAGDKLSEPGGRLVTLYTVYLYNNRDVLLAIFFLEIMMQRIVLDR
jgi:hypothetical protein